MPRLPRPRGFFRSWFRLGTAVFAVACAGCETISYGVKITHDGASLEVSQSDGKTVLSAEQGEDRVDFNFLKRNP